MNSRQEHKLETRRALLEGVYTLAAQGRSFSSMSLREVTREAGIVPAAFYRHFTSMEELGLAIVAEVVATLRGLLGSVRASAQDPDTAVQVSVRQFLDYVRLQAPAFAFLSRERAGGCEAIRRALAAEERKVIAELAGDMRFIPSLAHLPPEDLELVAGLLVGAVLNLLGEILELKGRGLRRPTRLAVRAIKQLRLVLVGARHWDPRRGAKGLPEV